MSTLNLNANINGAKRGLPYPTAGLDVIVYNSTYEDGGTTYLRTSTGVGIPLVSGTGLDTIWDFSVLNDDRFDKGSYVGNAYGLPEYYNYPYVGIYYDATSEATRYYWKITDFAYAVILAQSLLVDNMFFLKAKATTNTSNVIASWDRLFIYSTALTGSNLSKMKRYIGIQADFYGNELILNGNFTNGSDNWNISNGQWTFENERANLNSTIYTVLSQNISSNKRVIIKIDIFEYQTSGGIIVEASTFEGDYRELTRTGATSLDRYLNLSFDKNGISKISVWRQNPSQALNGFVDNISIKEFYQNYYKS